MADSDSNSSLEDLIETEDFRERLSELKAKWKAALKRNKKLLLKCPNYQKCQFKCSSVGGMQYHYERCTGNAPRFKCHQCSREYESRTGLNYHMTSSHINEPTEESRSDGSSRPQRSAALNTMSAIHISNNPPPLKQSPHRTPPTTHKTSHKTTPNSHNATPTNHNPLQENKEQPVPKTQPKQKAVPPAVDVMDQSPNKASVKKSPVPTTPVAKVSSLKKGEGEGKGKKGTKYVTIPSIEYPDEYKSYLPAWRQEMKDNKVIKCPNYKECDFKCTTVNGMKYHFVRCKKANPPEFNCELCGKKFQCRTGLVWHLKKTHKLIDIQPSKGGGFKGTVPSKLRLQPHLFTTDTILSSGGAARKKFKLNDGGRGGLGGRSPGSQKFQVQYDEEMHDDLFGAKRRRKCYIPQRTPEEILQNVVVFQALPSPKLGPESIKLFIPLPEYSIYNDIPTDKAHLPSAVIQLGEEALTWQRLSSDSESDGEYQPEREYEDTFDFGGYKSNNSLSDSDEDYMCSLSKKKGKTKSSTMVTSGGRTGGRRGKGIKRDEAKDQQLETLPMDISAFPGSGSFPPPLLQRKNKKNDTIPAVPALIKAPPDFDISRDSTLDAFTSQSESDGYITKAYLPSLHLSHVQPPPSLIMPIKSEHSNTIRGHSTKLPEPPPLLKNSDNIDLLASSPSDIHHHPHILLPSDVSVVNHHQTSGSTVWTGNHSTSHSHYPSSSSTSSVASPSKRLGKPSKSRNSGSQQSGKKSTAINLGSTKAHFKPSKSTKGYTSSYSMKKMKMTRYEFESTPSSSSVTGDIQRQAVTTTTHHNSHTPTHSQPSSFGSPVGSSIQNLVSPVQIIQGVPQQMQSYSALQPGSVVLMQGAHPLGVEFPPQQQVSPSYITQDGKTYQIVQTQSPHYVSPDPIDSSQKVSVIMQPGVGNSGGYVRTTGVGGMQYITQLDGPPPPPGKSNKKGDSSSKDKLKLEFEEARRQEQARLLGLDTSTKTSGNKNQISPERCKVDPLARCTQGAEAPSYQRGASTGTSNSAGTTPETRMSEQLKMYFKREVARKSKPSHVPLSDPSSLCAMPTSSVPGVHQIKQESSVSQKPKRKGYMRRQRSTSSISNSSDIASPVTEKSPKSPRLVISLNLFSSPIRSVQGPSSVSGMESGNVTSKQAKVKLGKDLKKISKHSSPDLSNLFQPDKVIQPSKDVLPSCLGVIAEPFDSLPEMCDQSPCVEPITKPDMDHKDVGNDSEMDVSRSRSGVLFPCVSCNSNNSNANEMTASSGSSSLNSPTSDASRDEQDEEQEAVANKSTTVKSRLGKRSVQAREQDSREEEEEPAEACSPTPNPAPKRKRGPGRPPGKSKNSKKAKGQASKVNIDRDPTISTEDSTVAVISSPGPSCSSVSKPSASSTLKRGQRPKLGKRSVECRELEDEDTGEDAHLIPKQTGECPGKCEKQQDNDTPVSEASDVPLKRKKGRPKKVKTPLQSKEPVPDSPVSDHSIPSADTSLNIPTRKKRGRPRKTADSTPQATPSDTTPETRERPRNITGFKCDICDITYSTKLGLRYHKDSVHPPVMDADTPRKDCLVVWRTVIKKTKSVMCSKCECYRANSVPAMDYHWQRCGREEEAFSVTCPHCAKVYKSKAGLVYHIGAVHTIKKEPKKKSPSPEPVFVDPSLPVPARKAAAKAIKRLSTQLAAEGAGTSSLSVSLSDASLKKKQVVGEGSVLADEDKVSALKKQIADTGTVECPVEMCVRTFTTFAGLRYHLMNHTGRNPQQKYSCPMCPRVLSGVKRFENHLKRKHPDEEFNIQNVGDREYVPKEEESDVEAPEDWEAEKDEIESAEEPEEPKSSNKATPNKLVSRSSLVWLHGEPQHYQHYRNKVREIRRVLYEHTDQPPLSGGDWHVKLHHWKRVEESEFHSYIPEASQSIFFNVQSQKVEKEGMADHTLPLFSSRELGPGVNGAMLFAGGPVWSMDWLPISDSSLDHYVALCAYRGLDETFHMKTTFSHCGLIQLWRMGTLTNKQTSTNQQGLTPAVEFSLGVAHRYGVIRDMKWCPSVCSAREGEGNRLGVLAVACSDGAVRILVLPKPNDLTQHFSTKKTAVKKRKAFLKGKSKATSSNIHLIATLDKEAAILVPTGFGVSDWSKIGQCLCLDWLPSSKHTRVAAGFSNGLVCVWDLEINLPWSPHPGSSEDGLVINPIVQLTAHKAPCRTVTWCPHDVNYLFTGGYDRFGSLWDLRQPYSPLERQEKGLFVDSAWPLVWCGVLVQHEVTVSAYPQSLVYQLPYLYSQPGNRAYKNTLLCSAPPTSMSYCAWSDRLAASSFSGELCVKVFSSHFHMASSSHQNTKEYKALYLCYKESLAPPTTPPTTALVEDSKSSPSSKSIQQKRKRKRATTKRKNTKETLSEESDLKASLHHTSTDHPTSRPQTMTSLAETSRLVFSISPSRDLTTSRGTLSPADTPLSATTKVCWSPNECSYEWMVVGTNSGLVQLLHVPAPKEKPRSTCSQGSLVHN